MTQSEFGVRASDGDDAAVQEEVMEGRSASEGSSKMGRRDFEVFDDDEFLPKILCMKSNL